MAETLGVLGTPTDQIPKLYELFKKEMKEKQQKTETQE